jgi:DNA-binding CsgD family transcriptional regulator
VLRGDLRDGRNHIEQVGAMPPANLGVWGAAASSWIEARIAEAEQGPTRSFAAFAVIYDGLPAHKRLLIEDPGAAAWLVRAALAADDRERADTVAACAELLAADNTGLASIVAAALHARGLLDADPVALERAAAQHRHPWAKSSAFEDAGVVLGARGEREAAHAQLERALAGYDSAGSDRDAARVRGRLKHAGVPHSRPESGLAGLTETERRVADHVATGLANSQIADRMLLSLRLVDFYVRRIFAKLGIGSRAELTRIVGKRAGSSR